MAKRNVPDEEWSMNSLPKKAKVSRKDRSIGLVTEQIFAQLPDIPFEGEFWEMSVDQVMKSLGATRGSVYEVLP